MYNKPPHPFSSHPSRQPPSFFPIRLPPPPPFPTASSFFSCRLQFLLSSSSSSFPPSILSLFHFSLLLLFPPSLHLLALIPYPAERRWDLRTRSEIEALNSRSPSLILFCLLSSSPVFFSSSNHLPEIFPSRAPHPSIPVSKFYSDGKQLIETTDIKDMNHKLRVSKIYSDEQTIEVTRYTSFFFSGAIGAGAMLSERRRWRFRIFFSFTATTHKSVWALIHQFPFFKIRNPN